MTIHDTPSTYTPTKPSAFDLLNSRLNRVANRVYTTENKINNISEDVSNLDDALCELSSDIDARVADVEDALCELSEESEV